MSVIPDPIVPTPVTGDALAAYLDKAIATLRQAVSIRTKDQIPKDALGAAAVRYLGSQVMGLVPRVRGFIVSVVDTGGLSGLVFTVADFDQAVTRVNDTHEADTRLSGLSKDAHAEAVAALQHLAGMILAVLQSYVGTINLKSADPKIKAKFKDVGGKLAASLAQIAQGRKSSKTTNAKVKTMGGTISAQKEQIDNFETASVVQKLQDQLKLQSMTGEPLRPKDLVVADQSTDTEAQAAPSYDRQTGTKQTTSATPSAPAGSKARRKSPR